MAKGRPAMCERCGGKSRRGWTVGGMVAGGAFASLAFATLGAAPTSVRVQDVVVAREFRVVDEHLRERIVMSCAGGVTSITVYNADRDQVAAIEDGDNGIVTLGLHAYKGADGRGKGDIMMGLARDGTPSIFASDATGTLRAVPLGERTHVGRGR